MKTYPDAHQRGTVACYYNLAEADPRITTCRLSLEPRQLPVGAAHALLHDLVTTEKIFAPSPHETAVDVGISHQTLWSLLIEHRSYKEGHSFQQKEMTIASFSHMPNRTVSDGLLYADLVGSHIYGSDATGRSGNRRS